MDIEHVQYRYDVGVILLKAVIAKCIEIGKIYVKHNILYNRTSDIIPTRRIPKGLIVTVMYYNNDVLVIDTDTTYTDIVEFIELHNQTYCPKCGQGCVIDDQDNDFKCPYCKYENKEIQM